MRPLALALIASLLAACAQVHTLRIEAEDHWVDDTAVAPRVAERGYRRIAVMPPPTTTEKADEALPLAPLEAEFLRQGLEVFTSALAPTALGVAVQDPPTAEETDALSDIERALLRARQTNAQALLQIEALEWSDDRLSRYFIFDGDALVPTNQHGYTYHSGFGRYLRFPGVVFQGRLIDVASGEVVIAFSIRDNLISGLEQSYTESYEFPGWFGSDHVALHSASAMLDEEWLAAVHGRVMRRLCARIAACIVGDVEAAATTSPAG